MAEIDVTCQNCGRILDVEPHEVNFPGTPCPSCGSTLKRIHLSLKVPVTVTSQVKANIRILRNVNLLLKTTVILSDKTSEGRIVEAVSTPWFDIIRMIKNDPSTAFQVSPDKWEEIIAGAYKKAGFDEVILTPRSGDLGRDVIATKRGLGQVRVIDQVKAYKPDHLVTADDIRALMGVLQCDGASKGFLSTTSDFAPKIREDPLIVPFIPQRLELINGRTLFSRLDEIAKRSI